MRSLPPILRALLIGVGILVISWTGADLIGRNLPANRTSSAAEALMLTMGILAIGGPIIGFFLAVGHYRRSTLDPARLLFTPFLDDPIQRRRRRAVRFVMVGLPVGFGLMIYFAAMVIPAAWLAGGGDMPVGHGNPSDMRVGWTVLCIVIGVAGVGAILFLTSLVVGIGLLLSRGGNAD